MQRRGAHPGELSSLLATSSAMSETIPPSLVLITIGSVVPGLSIAALFTGGLLPALVAALALVIVAWWRARKEDKGASERAPLPTIVRTVLIALPGLSLPFVIRYTVIKGVATATEVSTIGIVYTALLGILVYRQFDWRRIYPILTETVSLTGAVMMIIGTATGMAWALTQSGFSLWLVSAMAGVPGGSWGFLAVTIVAFIILGSVLEGLPAIVLFGPLLFPIAKTMGVHEVHYAMVVILAMGIGLFAPPFGVGFFGACAIGRTTAVRRRLLRRLRDRPHQPQRFDMAHLALYRRARRVAAGRRGDPLAVDRIPVARRCSSSTRPWRESTGVHKTPLGCG
jgi:tripartite ATP-independent transporter DctM subunit